MGYVRLTSEEDRKLYQGIKFHVYLILTSDANGWTVEPLTSVFAGDLTCASDHCTYLQRSKNGIGAGVLICSISVSMYSIVIDSVLLRGILTLTAPFSVSIWA